MNAIGYIRVSTGRQAEDDKYGPEAQRFILDNLDAMLSSESQPMG